jgi:hypothetical protein
MIRLLNNQNLRPKAKPLLTARQPASHRILQTYPNFFISINLSVDKVIMQK